MCQLSLHVTCTLEKRCIISHEWWCFWLCRCVCFTKAINFCRSLSMLVAMFTLAAASHSFSIVLFFPYDKSFFSLFCCINIFCSQCTGIHGLATYVFVCLSISCTSCHKVLIANAVALCYCLQMSSCIDFQMYHVVYFCIL